MTQFSVSICVLVGLFLILKTVLASDPCSSYATRTGEVRRSAAYTLTPSDTSICDNFLTEQWYKIDSLAGNEIVRTCPSMLQCSTMYPLWMNGSLPDVLDGEADRTVCQSGIGGCCESSFAIRVKNCGSFYVYDLKKTTGCPVAYCFGTLYVDTSTVTTVPTTTESTSVTTKTTMSSAATTTTSSVALTTTREQSSPLISGKPPDHMHKYHGDREKDMYTEIHVVVAIVLIVLTVIVVIVVLAVLYCKVFKSGKDPHNKKVCPGVFKDVFFTQTFPLDPTKPSLQVIDDDVPSVKVDNNMPKLNVQKLRKQRVK